MKFPFYALRATDSEMTASKPVTDIICSLFRTRGIAWSSESTKLTFEKTRDIVGAVDEIVFE